MKKWVDVELDLDDDLIEQLQEKATEMNMTLNELVNDILIERISEEITMGDFAHLIEDFENGLVESPFLKFWTIIDDFKKPIARITPYDNE
jgi:hypothetical protein